MATAPLDSVQVGEEAPTQQPVEQESVVKMVRRLLDWSKSGTKELRAQWPTNYKFVMGGQQWPLERPEWRFSEVINTTWADIITEVGIQTDARPKTDYVPTEPSDIPFCEVMKEINDINWQKYPWLQRVAENILDSKIYHASHCEVLWNPELENGLGDVEHKILDPYGCYWDPSAVDEESLRFFIYVEPVSTEDLKNKYPDQKDSIKGDVQEVGYQGWVLKADTDVDRTKFTLGSGTTGRRPAPTNSKFGGEPRTLLIRCWLRDDSLEELVNESETPGGAIKKEYVLKKKFPGGRYIEIAGNLVLKDGPNGVDIGGETVPYKHGKFPIVRWVNYSYPREYAGENEVTHQMGPQIIGNYAWSFALDTMKQASNPKEVFSAANLEASEKSSNEPGQVLVLNDFNGYKREPGQGIPPGLDNIIQRAFDFKTKVNGLMDVMKGAVDPSIGSGVMLDAYVEAAQVRPRLKARNVDQSLQRLGQLDAALYLQFYKAPRTFRLTGKGDWPEFVTFFIQDGPQGQVANIQRSAPDMNGKYVQGSNQQIPVKGLPDVKVTTGSSIPFQKGVQYNRAKELFTMGAIDQTALLDQIEWPNKDEILERMSQAAQQAAAQAPPGGK
jgi:hypothetical protein